MRGIIDGARQQAAAAVNCAMVLAYWRIGEHIVQAEQGGADRAGCGEQLLAGLGRTPGQEFERGCSERSLCETRQFYQAYRSWRAARAELSWTLCRFTLKSL